VDLVAHMAEVEVEALMVAGLAVPAELAPFVSFGD
jgi:hypothetical protein